MHFGSAERTNPRFHLGAIALMVLALSALALTLSADLIAGRPLDIGRTQLMALIPAVFTFAVGALLAWPQLNITARGRMGLYSVGAGTAVVAGLVVILAVGIELEKGQEFAHDATTGPQKVVSKVLRPATLRGMGVCRCAPDHVTPMILEGEFGSHVAIYDRGGSGPRPGLVVVHGNTWLGGDLSTYRVLGNELAKRGFIVLTFDFPGFGRADDPFGRGPDLVASAYNSQAHVNSAIDFLIANTDVDLARIAVFGHSGGAEWALRAAASNPHVSRVAVMYAPPLPLTVTADDVVDSGEHAEQRAQYFDNRAKERHRFIYGRDRPDWYNWELTRRDDRFGDDIWDQYRAFGHKPVMIVLAEYDQPAGHPGLRNHFATLSEPKSLLFLSRSDHYLNTAQALGLVFYDRQVAHDLADGLTAWFLDNDR